MAILLAILAICSGTYSQYVIVYDGDSITYGSGARDYEDYPSQLMDLLGAHFRYDWFNEAVPGETTEDIISGGAAVDLLYDSNAPSNIVCVMGGTNNGNGADTCYISADSIYANLVTYCTARQSQGFKVIILTLLPCGRDNWINYGWEAKRDSVNTELRSNYATFADALCDVGASPLIGDSLDAYNTTYFDSDRVHLNATGYGVMADSVIKYVEALI